MIKRLSHIGVLVNNLELATAFWYDTYGLQKYAEYETEVEGIKAYLLSVSGRRDDMSIELIEPLDKSDMSNPIARRLAENGEGFYHLAVIVDDVLASGEDLAARGLTPIPQPPVVGVTGERWLIHPRASDGIMVEELTTGARDGRDVLLTATRGGVLDADTL